VKVEVLLWFRAVGPSLATGSGVGLPTKAAKGLPG
jgi:hypothetical protein